jgi:hypothetical protein
MSKRTPTTPSKHVHSPKIAAKGQRAAQDIVRSPKDRRPRSVGADSTESLPNRHTDSEQTAPLVENPVTALQQEALLVVNQATALQQEAFLVENPATALQNDRKQMMADISTKKGFDFFSSATANVRVYQAKLLEMAQANMQFALEFAQRLATIRSPVDFFSVNAEFTSKRFDMFRKYSKEMVELSIKR